MYTEFDKKKLPDAAAPPAKQRTAENGSSAENTGSTEKRSSAGNKSSTNKRSSATNKSSTRNRRSTGKERTFGSEKALDRWIYAYLHRKRCEGPVVFLDSQLRGHASSGNGYIATNPAHTLELHGTNGLYDVNETDWEQQGSRHSNRQDSRQGGHNNSRQESGQDSRHSRKQERQPGSRQNAWDALTQFRKKHPDWMFGWFSYDLKNETEDLISRHYDPVGLPDLFFFVPEVVLAVDRAGCRIKVIKGDDHIGDDFSSSEPVNFGSSEPANGEIPSSKDCATGIFGDEPFQVGSLVSGDGWEAYREKINRVMKYITEGDAYEINLTHQLNAPCKGDTLELFDRMKQYGPVPFAAWIHYDDVEVCCASPERFLQHKDGRIRSQPIKGTSPRGATPQEDRQIVREILQKEKNRAENVMIVDLVRHDLGRVARTGSVHTDALLEVQSFSTVHQLVSTISAERKPEIHPVDVIKACFPMGSMTGAPKIRTMQIIEELESYRRGLYSGAIGYFTPQDDFDLNVVIRTAIRKENRLYYPVGGAVTADSDPREEWEETWLKAKALSI